MVVRSDSAGGSGSSGGSGFKWPAGQLALQPAAPKKPFVWPAGELATQSPSIQAAPYYGGTVPSPAASQAQPSTYGYAPSPSGVGINANAPYSAPQGGGGGSIGGGFAPVDNTPAPPPPPAVGGRQWYNGLGADGQKAEDAKWLGGDSDYTAQIAEYDKALQAFVGRIADQRKGFTEDANLATASTNRNQTTSVNNLGEDFGARGLSYSGLFDTSKNEVNGRFNEAKAGIERMRAKNDGDAVNREKDYRAENGISRGNAQRASLGREAQRQALIDSMGAF